MAAGLVPARSAAESRRRFPLLRFPWERTEAALRDLARHAVPRVIAVDFVDPETGDDPLPTIGLTALMVRAGDGVRPAIKSSSAVFHAVKGRGRTLVDGETFDCQPACVQLELRVDLARLNIGIADLPDRERQRHVARPFELHAAKRAIGDRDRAVEIDLVCP